MHTFRSDEMMFEGDDLGEAHPLELEAPNQNQNPTPTSTPTLNGGVPHTPPRFRLATRRSASLTSTWRPLEPSSYVPPAPLVLSNALIAAMTEIPMSVWKRLAIYPFSLWLIVFLMLPCRLNGAVTLILFGLSGIGTVGAWLRYRAYDRFVSRID